MLVLPTHQQIPKERLQALWQHRWLLQEQACYPYLPATGWMRRGGYIVVGAGAYEHTTANGIVHRLTVLSQTSKLLVFRDGTYLGAHTVRTDEEFLRVLAGFDFPLPV